MARFIASAREYCALIPDFDRYPKTAFAHRLHRILPRLYADALWLPDAPAEHFEDADADEESERRAERAVSAERKRELLNGLSRYLGTAWDKYRDVDDPYDRNATALGHGWLSDDLTDTFGELATGLAMWDEGFQGHAVWELKFTFERHWGQHVLGALLALRALAEFHDLGFPQGELPAG